MGIREISVKLRSGSFATRQAVVAKMLSGVALYLLVVGLAVMFMFPFFWTISGSLKPIREMFLFPPTMWPSTPQWFNYKTVTTEVPFGQWVWNSTVLVVLSTTGQVLTATIVAYSFARFRWPGRDIFFILTLGTMMIPGWVTLIPRYLIFRQLHWLDSIKPLWVPCWFGGGAFYIFLIRQFIMALPRELDEAAYIDGAGPLRIFWSIIVPLCRPVLATVAVIAMIGHWGDFMGPLIYLNSTEKFTVSIGLNYFKNQPGASYIPRDNLLMAACVLSAIPPILLFFAAQRYFVRGVVLSGIKG